MPTTENLYLYHLTLEPHYQNPANWTDAAAQIIRNHAEFLDRLGQQGILGLAGRTQYEPGHPHLFGIAIIKAASLEAAQEIMAGDPAVVNGIQRAAIHPYAIAINHVHNLISSP